MPHTCDLCCIGWSTKSERQYHVHRLEKHHRLPPENICIYYCYTCDKAYATKKAYTPHLKHDDSLKKEKPERRVQRFRSV